MSVAAETIQGNWYQGFEIESEQEAFPGTNVPTEMALRIFNFLNVNELRDVVTVSKSWSVLASSPYALVHPESLPLF